MSNNPFHILYKSRLNFLLRLHSMQYTNIERIVAQPAIISLSRIGIMESKP